MNGKFDRCAVTSCCQIFKLRYIFAFHRQTEIYISLCFMDVHRLDVCMYHRVSELFNVAVVVLLPNEMSHSQRLTPRTAAAVLLYCSPAAVLTSSSDSGETRAVSREAASLNITSSFLLRRAWRETSRFG